MTLKNDENLTNFDSRTKSLKNLHFNGLLLKRLYSAWAKKVQRCYVYLHSRFLQSMMENWLVFPKIDMRSLANFHQSAWKSPNWDLCLQNAILSSKVENVWALQGSYLSSQWRVMQKLKRNWLVSSKLTWGIWQILTWALKNLKNLHFNGFLLNKVYNFWAKRSIGGFCLMALNNDATFEGKLTCTFKNDMRNSANFHQSILKSLNIGTLMRSFYPKQKIHELRIYMRVLCHDSGEWYKIWRVINLSVQNRHEVFDKL